ncbi:MAG: tRNA 2-thiouridine(34) synthase MnmA [Bacteroidia bacterium]|nr:tRNA 2-thiouridine(34) synthase MnmA [Bacteroidia bacterium]
MTSKGKVLVAMSGGIDSTVAALMLHEQGYEVIGITMKTWDYETSGGSKKETGCCSLDSINDARTVAVKAGFHHLILDIRSEFGDHIIDNFVEEYLAGRTPNPCVLCNTHIKWEALLKRADQLGCEFIATGHYAQVRNVNDRYVVSKGIDIKKDQSYVLWGLSQASLARTLFPLGTLQKTYIKQLAVEAGLFELANKSESYEICFVPDNDYRAFLKHKDPLLEARVNGGNFIDRSGKVLGQHKGYPFYTIGQRKGLVIAFGTPAFVLEIIPETNIVVLGSQEELQEQQMYVRSFSLSKYASIDQAPDLLTKIRYKDAGTMSSITQIGDLLKVTFHKPVQGLAPGQSAVFYDGDDLVGGGFIMRKNDPLIVLNESKIKELSKA